MDDINNIYENVYKYLKHNYRAIEDHRVFYGISYLANIFEKDNEILNYTIEQYKKVDTSANNFHWEFNNYAWINLLEHQNLPKVKGFTNKLVFQGTKVTNWTLLRNLCYIKNNVLYGRNYDLYLKEIKKKIIDNQLNSGLIQDDPLNNSLQYHCYSTALLIEIYDITQDKEIKDFILKATNFIYNFILPNGQSLYIGRGQEQIFGYGSLVFILEKRYQYTREIKFKFAQKNVLKYIKSFLRKDGSLPLVLRKDEKKIPKTIDMNKNENLGWYSYNNYYDYLPFFLYYIKKTLQNYQAVSTETGEYTFQDYQDDHFLIKNTKTHIYVISKPGGAISNDIPVPYVFDKKSNTSLGLSYGGEEYQSPLYSSSGIPLPYFKPCLLQLPFLFTGKNILKFLYGEMKNLKNHNQYFFRKELQFKITNNSIHGENKFFIFTRKFIFQENNIYIQDNFVFKKNIWYKEFQIFSIFFKGNISVNSEGTKFETKNFMIDIKKENSINIFVDNETYYNFNSKLNRLVGTLKTKKIKKGSCIGLSYNIEFYE